MSENRVIGRGNAIPWHIPEDFKWFKRMTLGHVLVMGRKTFQSIGRPLPGRETIVLSRTVPSLPNVRVVPDLSQINPGPDSRDYFICGGAEVYAQALPACSDLFLTLVKRVVEGDTFFPEFENLFILAGELEDRAEFKILHYIRKPVG